VTDEFERQLGDMLSDRVADLPASYEVEPSTLRCARRRRGMKLAAFSTALVLVVAGIGATVVAVVNGSGSDNVVSAVGTRPSVETVRCPSTGGADAGSSPGAPPVIEPRVPTAGDPAVLSHLVSYAAFDDPRYVLLGPEGWYCSTILGTDGQNGLVVGAQRSSGVDVSGISIVNDVLWHGGVGSPLACQVSDDAAVKAYMRANFPDLGPCPPAGRVLTRVDSDTTTFTDPDGTRGAGWLSLPSSNTADDGNVSVLTCRPTPGLTSADCATIIADWVARIGEIDQASVTVPTHRCPITYAITPDSPLPAPSTAPRRLTVAGGAGLASYAATNDDRYVALAPEGLTCATQVAADGQAGMTIGSENAPGTNLGRISIVNDYLWHGGVGSILACSASDVPAVRQYVEQNFPDARPCPTAGRSMTRVDAHAETFVDRDGTRGASWIVLPSADGADDGELSVLTCRPTDGLTVAECDTIVADYVARLPRSG
jgi:hypothetical protein